jgi:hypothetical protein
LLRPPLLEGFYQVDCFRSTDCTMNVMPRLTRAK